MFNLKNLCCVAFYGVIFILSQHALSSQDEIKFSAGKIHICSGKACEEYSLPDDILVDSNSSFEKQNIDEELGDEILITTNSDVNKCSTVLYVDRDSKALKKYADGRDICNFNKTSEGRIVSNYRDGAMWSQDLIDVKNKSMRLIFHDTCLDCEEVKREYFLNGVTEKMLVNKSENILDRKQIQGTVVVDKASIAGSFQDLEGAKSYLVKGDRVLLIDSLNDEKNQFFFLVSYKGKNEKNIIKWIRCEDLDVCN